jgi:hypothetical protein
MDSEDELQEENAEDIASNENSAIDENEGGDPEEEEEEKWLVPDGHFSNDEVSDIDEVEAGNSAYKINGIMELLEIRKNYPKYIQITIADRVYDPKIRLLSEHLRAKPFGLRGVFPIVLSDKKEEEKKITGLNTFIEDRLDDVVREIHGNYFNKDIIIKAINEKYPAINKTALHNFFRENCIKDTLTNGPVSLK